MPRYISNVDLWLSHENRKVAAGTEFTTVFPTVLRGDGTEGSMHLAPHIKEVKEPKGKGKTDPPAGASTGSDLT